MTATYQHAPVKTLAQVIGELPPAGEVDPELERLFHDLPGRLGALRPQNVTVVPELYGAAIVDLIRQACSTQQVHYYGLWRYSQPTRYMGMIQTLSDTLFAEPPVLVWNNAVYEPADFALVWHDQADLGT